MGIGSSKWVPLPTVEFKIFEIRNSCLESFSWRSWAPDGVLGLIEGGIVDNEPLIASIKVSMAVILLQNQSMSS
ncbi:Hypothetical predicted protein [Olea europaea subsp. europaea]|uniref:Uncharacterized protein n=1 Tax=Olea europaea subsp. europaea TaxID=158383 RepID=A0A8S0VFQ0_OLEEU|nr:Hypothetical predicted protein [Olea europaea subsp. europaea]